MFLFQTWGSVKVFFVKNLFTLCWVFPNVIFCLLFARLEAGKGDFQHRDDVGGSQVLFRNNNWYETPYLITSDPFLTDFRTESSCSLPILSVEFSLLVIWGSLLEKQVEGFQKCRTILSWLAFFLKTTPFLFSIHTRLEQTENLNHFPIHPLLSNLKGKFF